MKAKLHSLQLIILLLVFAIRNFAQVPYEWPIINSNLTPKLHTINNKINSLWAAQGNQSYCTRFAGNLQVASGNMGYSLFTSTPPGPFSQAHENYMLAKADTFLLAMDSLGYKAVEISIGYPLLCDSFPNHQI